MIVPDLPSEDLPSPSASRLSPTCRSLQNVLVMLATVVRYDDQTELCEYDRTLQLV